MELTRRQALKASAGALTVAATAGYATAQSEEHVMEFLAEEHIDHQHACLHGDFDDRTPLEAGGSAEEAPSVDDTHVIWEATYEGEGYVVFDADAHAYDGPFVFYTADGSVHPVAGTETERGEVDDEYCESLHEYVQIEPEDGQIALELVADSDDGEDDDEGEEDDDPTDDEPADDEPADDEPEDDEDDPDEDDEDDHDDEDDDHGHDDLVGDLEIIDRETDEVVADVHDDHWHGDLPEVPVDGHVSLGATFEDPDGEEIPIGSDEEYQLNAALAEGTAEILTVDSHGDHVHLIGEEAGKTEVVFSLWHDDHADWESPPIAAVVVETDEEEPEDDEDPDDEDEPENEEPEANLELSVSPPEAVAAGEDARFHVITRNHGDASEVTVALEVGDAGESVTVEIGAGDCRAKWLCASGLPAGDHEWTVTAGEESERGTLTVDN